MSTATNLNVFIARLAPSFESQPADERLFEVVTGDGERIASATDELQIQCLAGDLNHALVCWARRVGSDAVIA